MSPVAQPIPLLLVADRPDTCERIASALLSAPAFYRIERVTSTELAENGAPGEAALALVDGSLRASRQAQVVTQLSASMPIVALVDPNDVQSLQEVVLAGAGSLVAVPFVDTQLWETVSSALSRSTRSTSGVGRAGGSNSGPSDGTVITLYGPKGGSGTSVLAGNLAVALQSRATRGAVLVEVGEGSGSQAVMLNLRAERTLGDLLARYDPGDTELLNSVLARHSSGTRLLLAPPTPGARIPPDLLDDVIDALRRMFDFVVVDIDSGSRNSALLLLRKANAPMLVITPEMTALHYVRVFVEAAESGTPDLHLNIVLNRSNIEGGVPADAIRKHLRMQIGAQVPDDQPLITASVNRGIPVVSSHPRSAVTRAIDKLAHDLVPASNAKPTTSLAPAPSPLSRLIQRGRTA